MLVAGQRAGQREEPRDDITWLLNTTNRMVRCRTVAALLDMAHDAIREGLGFDRVGLVLIDAPTQTLVEHVGTDAQGRKIYTGRVIPFVAGTYYYDVLTDPLMGADGPGFVLLSDPVREMPVKFRERLDGRPRQLLRVSLRSADGVIGKISVDNLVSGRPIDSADAPPLVAFANALAVAVENVSLLEGHARRIDDLDADLRRRVSELEWLRDIGRRVNVARTLDEVLDVVYDGIREGLSFDRAGIQLFDHDRGLWEELRGTDEQGHKMFSSGRAFSLAPESPIWEYPGVAALMGGAEYYYTANAVETTPPHLRYMLDGPSTDYLSVPLRAGDAVTGMISVDNLLSGRPIGPAEVAPLLALANQVGTAVENARLRERERIERARLEALLETARALNSTLNREQILHELAALLVAALDASSVMLTEVDLATRTVRGIVHHTAPDRARLFANPQLETHGSFDTCPVIERVARTRVPVIGYADDAELIAAERAYLRAHDIAAELLVPVIVQGEVSSIFEIYWDRHVAITTDMVALCMAIAEQTAVALENARLYADAATRAERDALTGLLNHRAVLARVDAALADSLPFALLLLDVDNFKLFNDTHGHLTGDGVLMQVSATLREVCRDLDAAGRYGGDEFAVVLHGATSGDAAAIARRLGTAIRARPHVTHDGHVVPLSLSIGIACYPADGETRQELVALADGAMYAAKRRTGAAARLRNAPHRYGVDTEEAASPALSLRLSDASELLGDKPFAVLDDLVAAVDARDHYARDHSNDVVRLALLLAESLDLSPGQRRALAIAGRLHDIGMIAIPDRILRKPGKLTPEEREVVMRHVIYGIAIIRGVLDDADVIDAVAYHHERWDGSGYPYAISGASIPLLGRIMQIADAVSAMTLDRPYRQGRPWEHVKHELRAGAASQFDPALVEPFIAAIAPLFIHTAARVS